MLKELAAEGKGPRAAVTVISSKAQPQKGRRQDGGLSNRTAGRKHRRGCSEHGVIPARAKADWHSTYEFFTVDLTGDVAEEEEWSVGGVLTVLIEDIT